MATPFRSSSCRFASLLAPAALCLGLLSALPVQALQLECPGSLAVTQSASKVIPDWTVVDLEPGAAKWLRAAGISEGPPQELHLLKPDQIVGNPKVGRFVQHYRWSRSPLGPVQLVCYYHETTLVLYRALESDPRRCELDASVSGVGGKAFAVLRCDEPPRPR
jgi:hypothetical protein